MKYIILALCLIFSSLSNASVHFNVSVGKDFNSMFNDTFDSVYFQSVGDPVTVEKVIVRTSTGECELLANIRKPTRFKWGKRFSMPMWDCSREQVVSVAIYTTKHIYTYSYGETS